MHETTPEFLEAHWVDARGICDHVDVVHLLNDRCRGDKRCAFVPLSFRKKRPHDNPSLKSQVLILDECDDPSSRKLLGTYRCLGRIDAPTGRSRW